MAISGWVFERVNSAGSPGGPYVNLPACIVLHTTETNTDPRKWVAGFQYPSHVLCSYEHDVILQLLDFWASAKALYNAPGGVETNRKPCIQIEINGYADDAGSWPDAKLKWIGEKVLSPIFDWLNTAGFGLDVTQIPAPGPHGGSASETAVQRMSFDEWNKFHGICGHRHVPENDHYDPDQMDIKKTVEYAVNFKSPLVPAEIDTTKDEFMFRFVIDETGTAYAVFGTKAWPISDGYVVTVMQKAGALMTKEQMIKSGFEWNIDRGSMFRAFEIQEITNTVPDKAF